MARIAGVNIPTNKRVIIALTYIHGIGPKFASEICTKVGIEPAKRVNELSEAVNALLKAQGVRRQPSPVRRAMRGATLTAAEAVSGATGAAGKVASGSSTAVKKRVKAAAGAARPAKK